MQAGHQGNVRGACPSPGLGQVSTTVVITRLEREREDGGGNGVIPKGVVQSWQTVHEMMTSSMVTSGCGIGGG